MQSVPGRAGLVREDQRRRLGFESSHHLVDIRLARADGANAHRRVRAVSLRVGEGDRICVDVECAAVIIATGCTTLGVPRTPVSAESPDRRCVAFVRNHANIDPPGQSLWLTDHSGATTMLRKRGGDTAWCNRIVALSATAATSGSGPAQGR